MGEIRLSLGAASDDTSLFPEVTVMWALNAGLAKISTEREWPWLFTVAPASTAVDDDTLTSPTGLSRLAYVTVDGFDLEEASARELAGERAFSDSSAPDSYAIEGETIRVSPKPDAVYGVEFGYFRHEPKITAGASQPLIPEAYDDWVVSAGAAKLAVRTNSTTRLAELNAEYAGWLARAMDNARRSAGVSRIRRTRANVWPEN